MADNIQGMFEKMRTDQEAGHAALVESTSSSTPEVETKSEESKPDPKPAAEVADKKDAIDATEEGGKETRATKRLRNLLAEKGESKKAIKERDALIAQLQKQLADKGESKPEPTQDEEPDWVSALLGETQTSTKQTEGMTHLEQRLHKMEVVQEMGNIRKAVTKVQKAHPDVPVELLLRAIEQDGDADIGLIAQQYDALVADIRSGGSSSTPEVKEEKKVVTRPKGKTSGGSSFPSSALAGKKFRSVTDIFAALRG